MAMVTRWNVERVIHGTGLYLDRDNHWSTDPEAAFEYSNPDEAFTDAFEYGGVAFRFERNARRSDLEFTHDSEAARLAYHFQAAE